MRLAKLLSVKVLAALLLSVSTSAMAGPIIIAGTDADDHGFFNGVSNQTGWSFMQKAFENIGSAVSNGNKNVVCIGCNGFQASNAYDSATTLSNLAGTWTFHTLTSATDIADFFSGTGTLNTGNTGIIYMPTVEDNVSGGISDAQLAIVNANGGILNGFVAGGGGLFTQEQANSSIGYGWLTSLLPGFTVMGDNNGGVWDSTHLQLTAAGNAAFPGLTDTDMSNATPWHAYFRNYGILQTLALGNGDNIGGFNDAVVIGGGAGQVIACGMQGQPPCAVPEPTSLGLVAVGAIGFLMRRRKSIK